MRKTKAIIHFNKQGSKTNTPWSIHWRGSCYLVAKIICKSQMVSEFKPEKKTNPRAFFTAQISDMQILSDKTAILY